MEQANDHSGWIPRDTWLEEWEKQAIFTYYADKPTSQLAASEMLMPLRNSS